MVISKGFPSIPGIVTWHKISEHICPNCTPHSGSTVTLRLVPSLSSILQCGFHKVRLGGFVSHTSMLKISLNRVHKVPNTLTIVLTQENLRRWQFNCIWNKTVSLFCFNLLGELTYLRGEHRNLGYELLIGRWLSLQRTRHFAHKQTKLSGRRNRTTPETTCKLLLINEGQLSTDRPKSIVHNYLLLFSLDCSLSNILCVYTSAQHKSNGSNLTSNQHKPYFRCAVAPPKYHTAVVHAAQLS